MTTVETQILTELRRRDPDADGTLVRLSTVRPKITGGYWAVQEAVTELWQRGEIAVVKVGGSPLIGLADEFDKAIGPKVYAA
ncbi:hypothetical protein BJF87_04085 [Gordonia sp. CNJ-863]|uniref:hypothetical protein n=1 Tax=Gordonia sp. CNJ-863 TaxID=1904963 RepID=UPI000960EF6E|nr:hypothetical protein [Gordonia sp. CNJ-863]OLT47430.1 hypothetical protein BJF87_04085 [Gordonia sp. CNJ-863]